MWLLFALLSSILLGGYDILKKSSLKGNSYIPVLFVATASGAILFFLVLMLSRCNIVKMDSLFYVPQISLTEHLWYILKAILVGSSWIFAYNALSKLPITIVAPIRSTGPVWTLLGAFCIYGERFNNVQWIAFLIVIFSSYLFARAGKNEGINFKYNHAIWAIFAATLLGSMSSLVDKYLLSQYDRMAVQTWYSMYMGVFMLIPLSFWWPKRNITPTFVWKWTIPMIGICLSVADFMYFYALSRPEALLGVVSVIRRSSVVIAFTLGAILFKEHNLKAKGIALLGIIIGVTLLVIGSH
ncbi:MAG: DMT family transporter [Salinivirgaceae bacterium]|nr:DMT family transporter [Salinivirgaceae bacterium]